MKFFLIILSFLLAGNGCSQSEINQDSISIEYSAVSRGIFKNIKINDKTISVVNSRGSSAIVNPLSKNDWKTLTNAMKSIDIKNIPNLKAPSKNFEFDGAAIAHLSVTVNETAYKTQSFDHGNPPKEIASLVKEILSIAENIE